MGETWKKQVWGSLIIILLSGYALHYYWYYRWKAIARCCLFFKHATIFPGVYLHCNILL